MGDRPVAKVRIRWSQLSFSFWDNKRKIPSITLTKSWRDDKGEWHNQNINVGRRDLVELAHQLPRVIGLYDKTASELRQKSPKEEAQTPRKTQPTKTTEVEVETYEFVE